jgi:hypothetical protein
MTEQDEQFQPPTTEERWAQFLYMYVNPGWFDEDRTKTLHALRQCFDRIPIEAWDEMPPLILFAPSSWKFGQVNPLATHSFPRPTIQAFVYLSPSLESESQEQLDFTVAHELAHALLGHHRPDNSEATHTLGSIPHEEAPSEIAADKLAESWGFKRPQGGTQCCAPEPKPLQPLKQFKGRKFRD